MLRSGAEEAHGGHERVFQLPARVREAARRVLTQNRRTGVSAWEGRRYDFVCPSRESYPFQWFWDSCFHAIALTHLDVALAEQELRCLLQGAQPNGFIPHMLLWEREAHEDVLATYNCSFSGRYTTATIQPPVLAQAVERVYQAGGSPTFLAEALPLVSVYHAWLAGHRDPDGGGLIAILQPDESGLDAAPKYDQALGLEELSNPGLRRAMRRLFAAYDGCWSDPSALLGRRVFTWVDCLVNACYLQGLAAEARLLEAAGQPEQAAAVRARRARGLRSLVERCWDERAGAFFDYYEVVDQASGAVRRQPARLLSISSLLPLILEDLPRPIVERLVHEHLLNPAEFWLPYGLPSVAASEPSFEPSFQSGLLWRGPTWVNTNWLLVHALRAHGFRALADELAARTVAMVERGGFRECFNPFTAASYGAHGFGWTTLVLDLW